MGDVQWIPLQGFFQEVFNDGFPYSPPGLLSRIQGGSPK